MWALKRYRSARSWMGQSDAIHSTARPATNQTTCRRLATGSPAANSPGPTRFRAYQ